MAASAGIWWRLEGMGGGDMPGPVAAARARIGWGPCLVGRKGQRRGADGVCGVKWGGQRNWRVIVSITTALFVASVVLSAFVLLITLFRRPSGRKEPAVQRMEDEIRRLRARLPRDEARAERYARDEAVREIGDLKARIARGESS